MANQPATSLFSRCVVREHADVLDDRARYVEPAIEGLIASGTDIRALTAALRVLSGVYEQAARAAAYEKGDVD